MKSPVSRILIIDDDSDIREVVGEALSFAGYQVSTARDGDRKSVV